MKILLVGNHPHDGSNSLSMTLFAELLLSALSARGHEVVLARPKPRIWELVGRGNRLGKWCKYVDQFAFFPFESRRLEQWADVVHICDHSNAPFLDYLSGKPCLVTCHDTIGMKRGLGLYREERAGWMGRKLQAWTIRNLRRADRIACVSRTVGRELEALLHLDGSRLSVVYNGLNHPYVPMDRMSADRKLAQLGLSPNRPFLLHVGSDEWKKNRLAVAEIFVELRRRNHPAAGHLVFAGAPLNPDLKRYLDRHGMENHVSSYGHLQGETLCALYSKADLFLFPSLYEGFGWPIIEAQASGALVATSNRDPMREVSGDGAIHIDPKNPREAAHTLAAMTEDEREATRRRGLENARRFTPESMIKGYETLYRSLLVSGGKSADLCPAA